MMNTSRQNLITLTAFGFEAIAVEIGLAIIGKLATTIAEPLIKEILGKEDVNYKKLHEQSLKRIRDILKEDMEEAFITLFISDCNFVRDRLITYVTTGKISVLIEAEDTASRCVFRLEPYGSKVFGGLFLACNLHLLSLRALAENEPTAWKEELLRKFPLYSELIRTTGIDFIKRVFESVEPCSCALFLNDSNKKNIVECPIEDRDRSVMWFYTYNFGVNSDFYDEKEECSKKHQEYYRDKILPEENLYAYSREVIKGYKNNQVDSID